VSLVLASIERERALVGVDTRARDPFGTEADISKFVLLPHVNALIANQGCGLLLGCTVAALLATRTEFDFLCDNMADVLRVAQTQVLAAMRVQHGDELARLVERAHITAVGWSPSANAMRGWTWFKDAEHDFTREPVERWMVSPWDEKFRYLGAPTDVEQMRRIAALQLATLREVEPECPAGGRLIVCELSQHAAYFRDAGKIDRVALSEPASANLR
jgi:hypothetical protein